MPPGIIVAHSELWKVLFLHRTVSLWLFLLVYCFDTVGWVIWPVKPVPDMTYNVFSGTLNPTQSIC